MIKATDEDAHHRLTLVERAPVLANLKDTMDTYVQAVTDEKREAQNKVVKMLLPGIRRAVI